MKSERAEPLVQHYNWSTWWVSKFFSFEFLVPNFFNPPLSTLQPLPVLCLFTLTRSMWFQPLVGLSSETTLLISTPRILILNHIPFEHQKCLVWGLKRPIYFFSKHADINELLKWNNCWAQELREAFVLSQSCSWSLLGFVLAGFRKAVGNNRSTDPAQSWEGDA